MAQESAINALGQFQLTTGFGPVGRLVEFTNSNEMMLLAAAIITVLFAIALRHRAMVPGRMQGLAEMSYEFVHQMVDDTIGHEGRRFFPFV
ncbi:MAG: F0F1 ATP synthase subunit A, partial [Acidiphilium sp. 21-62-4]